MVGSESATQLIEKEPEDDNEEKLKKEMKAMKKMYSFSDVKL